MEYDLTDLCIQEVGFFDTDSCTSELVSRISSDTLLVQEAIGDKVISSPQ